MFACMKPPQLSWAELSKWKRGQVSVEYQLFLHSARVSSFAYGAPQPATNGSFAAFLRHSYAMWPVADRFTRPQVAYSMCEYYGWYTPNSHGLLDIGTLSRGPSAWVLQVPTVGHESFPWEGPANRCPGLSRLLVPTQMLTPGPRRKS